MKDITKYVSNYRKVVINLCNQNFAISSGKFDDFIFEIDYPFSLIDRLLFE